METAANTFIKICGMTRQSDAQLAISLGADAVGMLFYEKSPRYINNDQASAIAKAVGDKGLKVGLFVDASAAKVRDVLDVVPLDILQFHGNEGQEFCLQFRRPFWKTIRIKEHDQFPNELANYDQAAGILLDTWHPTQAGGTGETFDWSILDELSFEQHLILAGGLNPQNVGSAITQVKPWAVDVSSGVESGPGEKSETLMKQFINEVNRVSNQTP